MNAPRVNPATTPPPDSTPAGEPAGSPRREDNPELYRAGKLRWLARWTVAPSRLAEVLARPDSFLAPPACLLANTELITLGIIPPLEPGTAPLLLRRLNYGRLRHRLRDVFRPTRAERAFKHGLALERAAVATPRVLAVGVQRCLCWPVRAYLITEYLTHALTLRQYLTRDGSLPRELGYRLADLVAHLHAHGFSHRDLGATNILFDAQQQPCLIDLDGVREYGQLPPSRALRDLERLAEELAASDLRLTWNPARFLVRYCRRRGLENLLHPWHQALTRHVQNQLEKRTLTASRRPAGKWA